VPDKEFQRLLGEIGVQVRTIRTSRGLSQEALAFDADIDRTYVSQIERARINPSLFVLHKIAKALGVSARVLLQVDRAE